MAQSRDLVQSTSTAVDSLLLSLDPLCGLRRIVADLDRLVTLDPKIREAARLLEERLSALTSDEDRNSVLTPVLWLQLRDFFASPGIFDAIRQRLTDGDAVLRQVESTLETIFSEESLSEVVRQVKAATSTEVEALTKSAVAQRLEMARQEVASLDVASVVPGFGAAIAIAVVTAGVCVGVAYLASEALQ
jgi:hypothetical protein